MCVNVANWVMRVQFEPKCSWVCKSLYPLLKALKKKKFLNTTLFYFNQELLFIIRLRSVPVDMPSVIYFNASVISAKWLETVNTLCFVLFKAWQRFRFKRQEGKLQHKPFEYWNEGKALQCLRWCRYHWRRKERRGGETPTARFRENSKHSR